MLSLSGVCRTRRGGGAPVEVLREVSLEIGAGELVAVTGPSGSGKSSLLHVLGCLDVPDAGRYRLFGEDAGALDAVRLATIRRQRIGLVFQSFNLVPELDARRNVELPMLYAGVPRARRARLAQALLERVGLAERAAHLPAELSGGQQQRVAIARALANDPPLLLADEPTGNLDSASAADVVRLLERLHRGGKTVILVTHDAALSRRAGRVITLADGRVVGDSGDP